MVSAPSGWVQPSPHRALDISEIPGIIEDYRKTAVRAKAAGFDGVELHAGNGYLLDQFLQDGSNQRTGNVAIDTGQGPIATEQLRKVFKGKIIAAGGFEPETAETTIENGVADAVAFGRHFVENPDLPLRIWEGFALTPYDRDTVYTFDSLGYNDYPFVNELASRQGHERAFKRCAPDASMFRAYRFRNLHTSLSTLIALNSATMSRGSPPSGLLPFSEGSTKMGCRRP